MKEVALEKGFEGRGGHLAFRNRDVVAAVRSSIKKHKWWWKVKMEKALWFSSSFPGHWTNAWCKEILWHGDKNQNNGKGLLAYSGMDAVYEVLVCFIQSCIDHRSQLVDINIFWSLFAWQVVLYVTDVSLEAMTVIFWRALDLESLISLLLQNLQRGNMFWFLMHFFKLNLRTLTKINGMLEEWLREYDSY